MVVATSPQAIKKAASFEAAFFILVADRTGLRPIYYAVLVFPESNAISSY
jgi:hypothetical protein